MKPILEARCVNCHAPGGIAPFALTDYEQAKAMSSSIAAAVSSRRMPPWRAGPADVAYLGNPQLSDEHIERLTRWAEGGARRGDPAEPPSVQLEPIGGGVGKVEVTLTLPEPYTPANAPDDYRCFPVAWPSTTTKYITGFNATPGSPTLVHHVAIYQVPPDSAALPFQWDTEEPGPGYTCFGGPFGGRPQQFPVNVVGAWIPGYSGVSNPRGLGVQIPAGSTLVLQMHYNVAAAAAAPDQTRVEFALADTVQNVAAYQPFLDPGWVAGAMQIAPQQTGALFQYVADPRSFFKLLGSPLNLDRGFNIEGVMFHMHKLGSVGELYLEKAGGGRVKVLSIPAWDFHWQQQYLLDQPVRFEPGDKLRLRCTFDNPTPRKVEWGEGSDDEMCVANVLSSE